MLIYHQDQQIVLWKTQNLELCFGTNVGTNQAKIEKIQVSISGAIWLGFLRSLVSAIRWRYLSQVRVSTLSGSFAPSSAM